ncbi:MAG TPA: penicillin-insensitive murein endopeptidase [Myxococcota bacterium]|nr:penicillin-insensitive murein endopeptidase [Myxococcota bacterium]HND29145.1 penicillin-insensitive murein endopeptidase [Myxococcota bacterium]HNH46537.1 penicillin-insensitive murein endopeptidase [Myxococcota bacterium]
MVLLATLLTAAAAGFGPSLEGFPLVPSGVGSVDSADTAAKVGCSGQYLQDGVQLPDLPLFYERVTPGSAWGTPEMIELLVETSRHMRWLMPEASKLVIGDISQQHGGVLEGHKSHRGGVDADVGIFRTGGWQSPRGFTDLYPDEFDVEANWALISAMLETGLVDMILLDRGHINRLMAYTLRTGLLTPAEVARIFPDEGSRGSWELSGVVRHAPGHTGHLHVRVLCSDGSKAE